MSSDNGESACGNAYISVISNGGTELDQINYFSITKSTASLFGYLSITNRYYMGGCSDNCRAIFAGGISPGRASYFNVIDYITLNTFGNAIDFGDLLLGQHARGMGNSTRGVFIDGGPYGFSSNSTGIQYVTIQTLSNAIDFGDLLLARTSPGMCSGN